MNKLLVVIVGAIAAGGGVPALAQSPEAGTVDIGQIVSDYDSCLAKATLRAARVGAPPSLRHDMSKRSCAEVRSSLLGGASADSAVSVALDAVDQARQDFLDGTTAAAGEKELAHAGNPMLLDRLAREATQENRTRNSRAGIASLPRSPSPPSSPSS